VPTQVKARRTVLLCYGVESFGHRFGGVWLLIIGLVGWSAVAAAASEPQLLFGEIWQTLSPDAKVAYILGIGNMVDFESVLAEPPASERRSFFPWLVKGMGGKSVN